MKERSENFLEPKEEPEDCKNVVTDEPFYEDHPITREMRCVLESLAAGWDQVCNPKTLQVIPLKGAMTNQVFEIKWPMKIKNAPSCRVLVRIYGEGVDAFFDRENEIRTFEFMSKQGKGPRLLHRFSNGRLEEFLSARTLSPPDLRDPDVSSQIAAALRAFHDLDMPGPGGKVACLWDRLKNWFETAKKLCPAEEAKEFQFDAIEKEMSLLERQLSGYHRVGFCHNDLQCGNIMLDEKTNSITIIDYEYSGYNLVAFDLANHFCEMAADYHSDTPHTLDYSKYPGEEERKRFVCRYLASPGFSTSDGEVQQLVDEVEKFTLASHLLWGLWGLISEHLNKIDFNYVEYARQRFAQYWLMKPILLEHGELNQHN